LWYPCCCWHPLLFQLSLVLLSGLLVMYFYRCCFFPRFPAMARVSLLLLSLLLLVLFCYWCFQLSWRPCCCWLHCCCWRLCATVGFPGVVGFPAVAGVLLAKVSAVAGDPAGAVALLCCNYWKLKHFIEYYRSGHFFAIGLSIIGTSR
jgi:hypothetical protein